MFDLFLHHQNMPFSIAIAVALLIGLVEIVSLLLGGLVSIDSIIPEKDIGVDADINGFSVVDYLCIGKIPLLMWLVVFLLSFGIIGIIFQSIFALNSTVAAIIVLFISAFPVRYISLLLQKIVPKDETTAIYDIDFIGYKAEIVLGTARRNYPAQAKFKDVHNQTHYVMVEPLSDTDEFVTGDTVVLYEKKGPIFLVSDYK